MGSPHGPWDLWTLLGAFKEKDTVFAEIDESGAFCFQCASCEHRFPIRLWPPRDPEDARAPGGARSEAAASAHPSAGRTSLAPPTTVTDHGVPKIGVDGKTPSLVAERLLLAAVRHHCAGSQHKATLHKLWPDLRRRVRADEDLELDRDGRCRNYVVVSVNGVRTLVSRHVGGSSAFEEGQEVIDEEMEAGGGPEGGNQPTAWLHHGATFLSHPYLDCDARANRVARHRDDGKISRRNRAWQPCRVRTGHPQAKGETWNPTNASYIPGAHSAAGRLAVVQHEPGERPAVRMVEMPVGRRDDTPADFAPVTDGATLRVVRVQPTRTAWHRRIRALTRAAIDEATRNERVGSVGGSVTPVPEGRAAGDDDARPSAAEDHLQGYLREQARQVLETAIANYDDLVDDDDGPPSGAA